MKKTYKATMHFSRPGVLRGFPWTVHFRGVCHTVREIRCMVPMVSEYKPTKKTNPRAFFTAHASELVILRGGVAVLT